MERSEIIAGTLLCISILRTYFISIHFILPSKYRRIREKVFKLRIRIDAHTYLNFK